MKYLRFKCLNHYGKFARTPRFLAKQSLYFYMPLALLLNSCSRVSLSTPFIEVDAKSSAPFKLISGSVKYGFGICKSGNNIVGMTFKPDYKEIERFKLFLKKNGHTNIERIVSSIELNAKTGDSKMYAATIEQYYKEIEKLNDPEDLFDRYYRFQVPHN